MVKHRSVICPLSSSEQPLLQELSFASVALATVSNVGHSPNNEDAAAVFAFDQETGIALLADGAGGLPAGAAASQHVIDTMQQTAKSFNKRKVRSLREAAIDSVFSANKKILNKKNGSGTTIAMMLIDKNKFQPLFVGDSILLVTDRQGKIKYINFPHSPIGYLYRGGIGVDDPNQLAAFTHIVSNLLGTQEMYIEIGPELPLNKTDTVLLCSDGLSDIMATKDIVDLIRSGTLQHAATNLLAEINRLIETRYAEHDDITFCLLRRNV